jgi:nitroimidazol reductase NimA-like FMN-containing flavoprotein (pyridoxamine 5'-phosphate oxidase superfamily)
MTGASGSCDPGDVGRRAAHRRQELGLSVEEVAARAGMAAGFLEYLETHPAQLTNPALIRLAAALQTSPGALMGAGVHRPPGEGGRADRRTRLEALTPAECRARLGSGGVGRVVFNDVRGPVAMPVNYRMHGDDVVFRTAVFSSLRGAPYARRVSFEVDHIDDAMREGWSVLVMGDAHEVQDADELHEVEQLGVEPWAGDDRPVFIRIKPRAVTGRGIRSD